MLWITESPWAASAPCSIAMPARMSGLSTTPPWSGAGPAITARCGSHALCCAIRSGPGDHRPVRIAQHNACAHADQLVHEEESRLEQLLEDQQDPFALRRDHDRDRHEVGGKGGPRAVLQLRDVPAQRSEERRVGK